MLLDHDGRQDSRVLWTLAALREAGLDARLFALHRVGPDRPAPTDAPQSLGGVRVQAVRLDDADIAPLPPALLRVLRWAKRGGRAGKASPVPDVRSGPARSEAPDPAEPAAPAPAPPSRVARINAVLGAWLWHRALARALDGPVRDFAPDLIHANDLSTLGAGAALSRSLGIPLLYDAHELELGRNNVPDSLAERVRQAHEGVFIGRADAVVTVSEGLSRRLAQRYSVAPPHVVINVPPDDAPTRAAKRDGEFRRMIYVGSMAPGRGVDVLVEALSALPGWGLDLLGGMDAPRKAVLRALAEAHGVQGRLRLLDPVPSDQVTRRLSEADVSVNSLQSTCESYRLSLPTKLFQSLRADCAVVSTPLPEAAAVLRTVGRGVVADGFDAASLARAVQAAADGAPAAPTPLDPAYSRERADRTYLSVVHALLGRTALPPKVDLPHASDREFQDALRAPWPARTGLVARGLAQLAAMGL